MKYPCDICGKNGHWKRNHNSDGSLPPHIKTFDEPINGSRHDAPGAAPKRLQDGNGNGKKITVSFNMATFVGSSANTTSSDELGPLVDDGAPYSEIVLVELNLFVDHLPSNPILETIPESLKEHTHCQYGTGRHASPARRILESIVLTAESDNRNPVRITHLLLDGSSQWVIGRNVTRKANIEHINRNALVFMIGDHRDYISLVYHNFLSYITMDRFHSSGNVESTLYCLSAIALEATPCSNIK